MKVLQQIQKIIKSFVEKDLFDFHWFINILQLSLKYLIFPWLSQHFHFESVFVIYLILVYQNNSIFWCQIRTAQTGTIILKGDVRYAHFYTFLHFSSHNHFYFFVLLREIRTGVRNTGPTTTTLEIILLVAILQTVVLTPTKRIPTIRMPSQMSYLFMIVDHDLYLY